MSRNMMKRAFSLFLCAILLLGNIPVALAAEQETPCVNHTEHIDCGYVEGETPCGHVCDLCRQEEAPAPEETTEPEDTTEPETTTEPEGTIEPAATENTQPVCTGLSDCAAETHNAGCEKASAEALSDNSCGESAVWSLDNGILTISGVGAMEDYQDARIAPWWHSDGIDPVNDITAIVVTEGITALGDYAFAALQSVTRVELPEGLLSIGAQAFLGCSLTELTVPASVTYLGSGAFAEAGISNIYFQGSAPVFDALAFAGLTATASYPDENTTWTDAVKQAYGGTITWLPISQLPHNFGDWQTIAPNTPMADGYQERTCSECGYTETQVIPMLRKVLDTPYVTISNSGTTGKPRLNWGSVWEAKWYQIWLVDSQTGEKSFLEQVTGTRFDHAAAEVGKEYTYQVVAITTTRCSEFSTARTTICKIARPTVREVTSEPISGNPIVQWDAVDGAVLYKVYRSTNNSSFTKIAETTELSVQDTTAVGGTYYYYRIKAEGAQTGMTSAESWSVSHTCICAQPVATIGSGDPSGITISWEKVNGAHYYYVYRVDPVAGTYTQLVKTSTLTYTDTTAPANQLCYYAVSVRGPDRTSMSAYSETVSYMNHTFSNWTVTVPSTPLASGEKERVCSECGHTETQVTPMLRKVLDTPYVTISNSGTTGKPRLNWGSVWEAKWYQIWLVDSQTGEKSFLEQVTGTQFDHAAAEVGKEYTYQVVAITTTRCSEFSTARTTICKIARPTVREVTSEPISGNPIVQWDAVDGAVLYKVYRSTNNSSFTKIAETTELSVQDTTAVGGTYYYYRIKAEGAQTGMTSAESWSVSHTCICARPVATIGSGDPSGITIRWEKVNGAHYYYVYRVDPVAGTYTQLVKTSTLTYTDTTAPANQLCYYAVSVRGPDRTSMSAYSETVSYMNHTFSDWTVTVPSTPLASGEKERVCSECGHTETQVTPMLRKVLDTPYVTISNSGTTGKPRLNWGSVWEAKWYQIWLVDSQTGEKSFLEQVTGTRFDHAAAEVGKEYTYQVVAITTTRCSEFSTARTTICKCAKPAISLTKDPDTNAEILSWDPVDGADTYEIYRTVVSGSNYMLVDTTADCFWTVSDEASGIQYYYVISARQHDIEGSNSVFSNVCATHGAGGFNIYAGQISPYCNKITWRAVPGASRYEVYRSSSKTGSYYMVANVTKTEYTDMLSSSKTYYYTVKAVGSTGIWSSSQAADKPSEVPVKIYLSPSCQTDNWYSYGNTSEAIQCRAIATLAVTALERCGFAALTNVVSGMSDRMTESNNWGAELHVPIHSNAFNGRAMGTQVYYGGNQRDMSQRAAQSIYNVLAPLSPGSGSDSMRYMSNLYEINKSNAPTAYIEVAFHDTYTEAKWIVENKAMIAEAICKGICNIYGVTYIAP